MTGTPSEQSHNMPRNTQRNKTLTTWVRSNSKTYACSVLSKPSVVPITIYKSLRNTREALLHGATDILRNSVPCVPALPRNIPGTRHSCLLLVSQRVFSAQLGASCTVVLRKIDSLRNNKIIRRRFFMQSMCYERKIIRKYFHVCNRCV